MPSNLITFIIGGTLSPRRSRSVPLFFCFHDHLGRSQTFLRIKLLREIVLLRPSALTPSRISSVVAPFLELLTDILNNGHRCMCTSATYFPAEKKFYYISLSLSLALHKFTPARCFVWCPFSNLDDSIITRFLSKWCVRSLSSVLFTGQFVDRGRMEVRSKIHCPYEVSPSIYFIATCTPAGSSFNDCPTPTSCAPGVLLPSQFHTHSFPYTTSCSISRVWPTQTFHLSASSFCPVVGSTPFSRS